METANTNPPRNGDAQVRLAPRAAALSGGQGDLYMERAAKRRGGGGPASEAPQRPKVRPKVLSEPIKTVKRARKLRRQMSPAEARLWNILRKKPDGYKFRRQFPQAGLSVDFACLSVRLGIEVDGESHDRGNQPRIDAWRDARLNERGFAVMRIPAWEVCNNLEGVLLGILEQCRTLGPLHHPPSADGPPPRSGEESP